MMALQAPPELLGFHTNFPGTIPPDIAKALQSNDPPSSSLSADERRAYEQLLVLFARRRAYASMMGTRPQTLYSLTDSPVSLDARPRRRLRTAGGGDHVCRDRAHGQWSSR